MLSASAVILSGVEYHITQTTLSVDLESLLPLAHLNSCPITLIESEKQPPPQPNTSQLQHQLAKSMLAISLNPVVCLQLSDPCCHVVFSRGPHSVMDPQMTHFSN